MIYWEPQSVQQRPQMAVILTECPLALSVYKDVIQGEIIFIRLLVKYNLQFYNKLFLS